MYLQNQYLAGPQVSAFNQACQLNIQQSHCTIMLFSRRQINDTMRRSFEYNFDGIERDNLQTAIAGTIANGQPLSIPSVGAIHPEAQGKLLNLRTFSDMWTFVLVVDDASTRSSLGLSTSIPSRIIYSGWIYDEPVTRTNFSAGFTINPGAILNFTHQTTLTIPTAMGSNGMMMGIQTTGDFDYLPGSIIQNVQTNGESLFDISPRNLLSTMSVDDFDNRANMLSVPLSTMNRSVEMNTDMNSAPKQLNNMVTSIADAVKNTQRAQPDLFGRDTFVESVKYGFANSTNVNFNDIDPSRPMSFGELTSKIPNMSIIVVNQPSGYSYEVGSNSAPTKRNIGTSLVASMLPNLMANSRLAEVGFRYNSTTAPTTYVNPGFMDRGSYTLMMVSTLYSSPYQQDITNCWNKFIYDFKVEVVPMLINMGGDFDITIHCSLAGASIVDLKFLDDIREPGYLETLNTLGGINSPNIGDSHNYLANSGQMFTVMLDTIAGAGQATPQQLVTALNS